MRLDPKYRVEKVVSKDALRPHLNAAHLDVDAKRLFATNGHALASVPVDVEARDRSGRVPVRALKQHRKGAKVVARLGLVVVGDELHRRGESNHPLATEANRTSVWPSFKRGDKGTVSVGLSAALLHELANALGEADPARAGVVLTFRPKTYEPILVEPATAGDAVGVLMPMRFDGDSK